MAKNRVNGVKFPQPPLPPLPLSSYATIQSLAVILLALSRVLNGDAEGAFSVFNYAIHFEEGGSSLKMEGGSPGGRLGKGKEQKRSRKDSATDVDGRGRRRRRVVRNPGKSSQSPDDYIRSCSAVLFLHQVITERFVLLLPRQSADLKFPSLPSLSLAFEDYIDSLLH